MTELVEAEIHARPLVLDDWLDGTVREGVTVYWKRDHAGEETFDPATLIRIKLPELTTEEPSTWNRREPAGEGRWFTSAGSATVKSMYGVESLRVALAEPSRDVYVLCPPDAEGAEAIAITPYWGASASIAVTVPGVQPEELAELLQRAVEEYMARIPGARVNSAHGRPLADRWINIYVRRSGDDDKVLVASNVLEGEPLDGTDWPAGWPGSTLTEEVPRSAIRSSS